MGKTFTIVAQLSSVHSSDEDLSARKVAAHVDNIVREAPLDILIVGWQERPELYRMLTSAESRPCPEVFLWYPLLSDYPGFDPSHLVVDSTSARSRGWGGYEDSGIAESFKQSCPNNPDAVSTTLAYLEKCMTTYPFDGVFLDKIRFPSAANGLQDVFSCFCPFCARKAAAAGLDLNEVRATLDARISATATSGEVSIPGGARWLEALVAGHPLLQRFIRFRADSITELITTAAQRMRALGKKVSLDVFSPILAPLVGQDFAALAPHADWAKPMIYRFGRGPSSLRTELPSLIRELGAYLGCGEAEAMKWAAAHADGLGGQTVGQIEEIAPLSLIRVETDHALSLFASTPVYLGLETVSIEGLMEVTPRNVEEILEIGTDAGVQGYVLSWDLLHTPVENMRPLAALRRRT
jgi:hypothetical protein